MNMIQSAKDQIAELTQKAYAAAVSEGLLPEGAFELDFIGKKSGRGAYLCREMDCLKSCRKSRRLEKSFGCRIPDEVYQKLEQELADEAE